MSVTRSFRSSWGICWSGAVKRPDPGGSPRGAGGCESRRRLTANARCVTEAGAQTMSAAATVMTEVEQVEQVADGRHVARYIGVVVILDGIRQVVATAPAECAVELPVAFDELHERGMLVVHV